MFYTPKCFKPNSNEQNYDLIKRNPFGTIISIRGDGDLQISKTPFELIRESDDYYLEGHLAKNNEHLKILKSDKRVNILFEGAHGYISPTYYKEPSQSVPTWNYSSVQFSGEVEIINDPKWLLDFLSRLAKRYEENEDWIQSIKPDFMSNLGRGAVGLRVKQAGVHGKFKLNQQTPVQEREELIRRVSIGHPKLAQDMNSVESYKREVV